MERSMVHELNGLASSQFLNNRSTFISTAFSKGDNDLRKSQITNLPSYRKVDLSNRMDFVVVFQSIEVERLSNEVEALRVALKDAERQNSNFQNYEVQIRELTEKCFAYENEREEYREEIDKLNSICEKLYEELEAMKARFEGIDPTIREKYRLERERTQKLEDDIERWKARYSAMETSKSREMEDLRLMMESQRKSMLDREIKELTLRFGSERQNLEKEIRKLREGLESRDLEIQRANSKISQLDILNQELRQYENTIDDYENKFAMLSQETVRLNELVRQKQEEIERLNYLEANYKRKISELERKLRDLEENGGEKARGLENEIREWKVKVSRLEDQNREYKQDLSQIPEFRQVIQQINTESERLKDAVRQKMGEVDDWKGRYQKVETDLRENKAQQEQKIPMFEAKLNQLGSENDRLNNALKSRAGEIENWRNKHSELERQITRFITIEQDKKNLENQLNNHVRQINELQGNVKELENQVRRLANVERELGNEKQEKQECKREIERLNNAVRSSSDKIDNLERKCLSLERDLQTFTQIQEELKIYKQKEINLTREIDRINGIINEKLREIQNLKEVFQRFESKLGQYQNIEKKLIDSVNQTQKLIRDLDDSRKENGLLQDKLLQSESKSKKIENDLYALSQEKEQIVRLINTRTQELEHAKSELVQAQSQIGQLRQKEARLREIEEQFRVSENKLNELDKRYKNEQNRSRELNNNLEQVNTELMKIKREGMMSPKFKEEFFELKSQTEQREREFRSLQQRIMTIEGIIRKLKEAILRQDQLAKKNSEKIGVVSKQFDITAQAIKKMFDLQNEVMKLNEENMQLEGKVRIMGVENETFKRSFNNSGVWESEREITSPVGSPLGLISAKRGDSFGSALDVPSSKRSSTYTNMVVSNVKPAPPSPSNLGRGYTSPSNLNSGNYTSSVSYSGSVSGLGGGLGGSGLGSMGLGNFNFGFPNSSTNVTTSTVTRTENLKNFDSDKRTQNPNQSGGSSYSNSFQFKTSNSRDF